MGSARIPTPLVLVLSGTMLVIGALAFLSPQFAGPDGERDAPLPGATPPAVDVRQGTPEAVAETFLDAWRKRDYEVAMALSVARAAASVEARRRRESAMTEQERETAAQLWNTMAEHRLLLEIHDRQAPDDDHVTLAAVARGRFLNQEYANAVRFELRRDDAGGWKVEAMDFPGAEDPFSASTEAR
jgi:hypothetical protein